MATTDIDSVPFAPTSLAERDIDVERRADGTILLGNRVPLDGYPVSIGTILAERAQVHPDRAFLAERDGEGGWRTLTYGAAEARSRAVARGLLDLGLDGTTPVACLSDASINFGVLKLAAMRVGIPLVPVSPAYSLMSRTFDKLRHIQALVGPRLFYAAKWAPFEKAFEVVGGAGAILVADDAPAGPGRLTFAELEASGAADISAAEAAVGPDTVAKLLMTSGSTGMPKAVINTQRTICSNGAAIDAVWPFLGEVPPVIVDWLPWSHTFGTNFNFSQILRHGGTMYIDAGRPAPGRMQPTLDNLRDVAPTLLYNVPRGFDMLLPELESDDDLGAHVFSKLRLIFYAGAGLPQALWDRLERLAIRHRGARIPIFTSLGSTETGPVASLIYWGSSVTGSVGLPVPGTEIKLVPTAGKLEMRVKGPNITPGYHNDPAATEAAFDEEGFFRLGDAVRLADPANPDRGLIFDGRVSENFKLMSGTWVHVGQLRLAILSEAGPLLQDAVVAGHDREDIALILFPNVEGCRRVAGAAMAAAPVGDLLASAAVRDAVAAALARHNAAQPANSTRIARAIFTAEPPTIDGNEITDKGYINQRAVLARRAELVERLYADPPDADVIVVERAGAVARSA